MLASYDGHLAKPISLQRIGIADDEKMKSSDSGQSMHPNPTVPIVTRPAADASTLAEYQYWSGPKSLGLVPELYPEKDSKE